MRDKFLQSKEWKTLRAATLFRDNSKCFLCGSRGKLCVHHIFYRRGNKGLQAKPMNLITLCACCHWLVHKQNLNILLGERLLEKRPFQYQWCMQQFERDKDNQKR